MKTLKAILLLFAAMAIVTACDPMEDESLRDKYTVSYTHLTLPTIA